VAGLEFRVTGFDYDRVPGVGSRNAFSLLAHGKAEKIGFPLFSPKSGGHVSASTFMDRAAATEAIASQNPGLPPPPPQARFVVAGQQAGLLTGPLYTFLKAVSAIALARRLAAGMGSPILPLFWVASEDHDVLEVNRAVLNGRRFVHPYPGEISHGAVPQVADISLMEAREPLLSFLKDALPETEFTPWVLDMVASADYSSYASAFRDLLGAMFREWSLRLVDPLPLRVLTAPVLADLVAKWPDVTAAMGRGAKNLQAAGLEPPLGSAGVFEIVEGKRVAVDFRVRTAQMAGREVSFEEASAEIRKRPSDFSPNAALRPVLQDAVLPVIATLGGPSELDYLWQIRPVYDVAGVVPSLLCPRISATILEDKICAAAERAGLGLAGIFEVEAALARYVPPETEDDGIRAIEKQGRLLLEEIENLCPGDPPRWFSKHRESLAYHLDKLVTRCREEKLESAGLGRKRLEKVAEAVLPGGKLQERAVNALEFLNLYGPDFIRCAVETLDPLRGEHQVVRVVAARKEE
jgi:bacillithiol biosynthesis cysteine-adding enzyme BshC